MPPSSFRLNLYAYQKLAKRENYSAKIPLKMKSLVYWNVTNSLHSKYLPMTLITL